MHTELDEEHDEHEEEEFHSTNTHNTSLMQGGKHSTQEQEKVPDEDDIEYDGELEIHHNVPKPNVSKLYSSLLQKQTDNNKNGQEVEIVSTNTASNNPLHSPVPVTQNRSRSSSSSSVSELSTPSLKTTTTTKMDATPSKRSLSTTARLQRFVVSKMAATSTGQELMTQALSEEAQMIIQWLIAAVRKYSSEEKANEIMEHFMKLTSKIAIYYSDGKLTSTEVQQFSESIMPVFTSLYICLNCSTVSVLGGLDKLIENIQKFHATSLKIIQNLMSDKNSSRFTKIIEFVQKKEFLITVFTSADFEENRNELKRIIKLLTE